MLRQDLQDYLSRVHPGSTIDTEHTLGGQVHIRFELGGDHENGSIARVNQATERALTIFTDTFGISSNEIWVLIYEYPAGSIFNSTNVYLHRQFPTDIFTNFYNQLETVNTRFITTDENGNDTLDQDEARIIIGRLPIKDIKINNILRGIANNEMGIDPGIDQRVFFFDPLTNRGFQMYDDRGCYVFSNSADKIRRIYVKRNDWIADFHSPEIDEYFK